MKYTKTLVSAVLALAALSCTEELSQSEFKPHEPRPAREMMSVEVIASIDTLDKGDTKALAPEEFSGMQTLWKWEEGDVAYAIYEIDGTTDVAVSTGIAIDPSDRSRATISFGEVPVDGKITAIETGSSGNLGRRIPSGTVMDKSMVWLSAEVQSEAGEPVISSVVLKNKCAYIRLSSGKVTMSGLKFDVSKMTVTGKGLFAGRDSDTIAIEIANGDEDFLLPVSRAASDVSVIATISAGEKQVASFPSFTSMPLLCRVDDSGDDTEKIILKAGVTLDAGAKSLAQTIAADLYAQTPGLWQWTAEDKIVANVLVGGVEGTIESDAVEVDGSDPAKAVFTFSTMPSTAKVTSLVFGSPEAFGKIHSAQEPVSRDMIYAKAQVNSAIGSTSISGIDLKHQCSYLNVFAHEVEIEGETYPVPSFSISGVGLKGDTQAVSLTVTNDAQAPDSVWVAVSTGTTTLQVVANTEVSGAMIFSLPSLGGTSNLFRVRPGAVQKVDYRTVLYEDGTFIINEMSTSTAMNTALHGSALTVYAPLTEQNTYDFKTAPEVIWASDKSKITAVQFGSATQPLSMAFWFSDASKLVSFDSSNLNTSACQSFNSTFMNCAKLSDIDVSFWEMSSATNCCNMFDACSSIKSLSTSRWNTSNVTDMHFMFRNCSSLETLDVSGWDVSKVTTFKFTFQSCQALGVLDVSKWVTSSVTDIQGIFRDCTSIKELNVSGWDVSKVTTMFQTFYGLKITTLDISTWNPVCVTNYENFFSGSNKLVTIDMSGCDLRSATSVTNMFRNCSSLETVYANDKCDLTGLSKDKSKGMFYKCVKLRGGLGTMLSDMVVSNNESDDVSAIKYARVDKEGAPGLFTEKK